MKTIDLELTYSESQVKLFFPETSFPKYTIAPKGRRGGLTKGAANAFIEYGLDESFWFLPKGSIYFLWGDTISANIDKYYERYFYPELKKLDSSLWTWKAQAHVLKIGRLTIDFRSADRPENWEGFGYHIIFLNEAGIILSDDYLFNNAVLPMLVDFPNAKLIAAGVPKGKRHKDGPHKFYELYLSALKDQVNYRILKFTGRNNPFISREELEQIATLMDDATRSQEIEGEFVDITEKKFLYAFSESKHVIPSYTPNPYLPIILSWDFNKDPMTCLVGQQLDIWQTVCFDEFEVMTGSTPELCEDIKAKYIGWWGNIKATGDATGWNRSAMTRGNLNHYRIIKEAFTMRDNDIEAPKSNPSHKDSRILCNSVLQNTNLQITANCKKTIHDLQVGNVDELGELIKDHKIGLHHFDTFRYMVELAYKDFIRHPEKYRKAA